jgi:PAS domain S-box-containing protein
MCVHDLDGVLLYVNPPAAETLQWRPEDGVGRNLREYLAPSVQPFFADYLARIRRNSTDRGLMVLVAKDGTEQIWSYRNVMLELPGLPAVVLGHAVDVTEQVRTHQALREVQRVLEERDARHETLVEGSPVGIAIDQHGVVRFANCAVARMHGYDSPADLVGRPLAVLLTAQERQRVAGYQTAVSRGGEPAGERIEAQHVRRDGSPIWVERWSSVVTWEQRPAVLTTFVDITDRKRLEERLRGYAAELEERVAERTAALQDTNAELESFSYSVSHDLRAPLRAMQGFATALLEEFGPQLDPVAQDYARRVVAAASRMDGLIQDLLAYSRVSRARLEMGAVAWSAVVEAAQAQLDAELRERGARVTVEGPLQAVLGHRATLVQVIANLLGNAIKFVPPGTAARVRVWTEQRGPVVRCWVEDNGVGIAPEHQERIFGIFERLHGGDRYPGTGIGLAIVRKGVERMGGRVGVESMPGEGSRFWVELPSAGSTE